MTCIHFAFGILGFWFDPKERG